MKQFFIFTGEYTTPTDGIITNGINYILDQLYPNNKKYFLPKTSRFFRDTNEIPNEFLYENEKIDAVIIPGSPYLWDRFYNTHKIKNIEKVMKIHKTAKLIWLGIGSCLPLGKFNIMHDKEHVENIKRIFKNSTVIVRDILALQILNNANINASLLPCPSFYNPVVNEIVSKEKLIVFYEPSIGISQVDWKRKEVLDKYYNNYIEFYDENTDVVVKDEKEVKFAENIGLKNIRVLDDFSDTLNTVNKYKYVLSGRIHIAVPALISGCSTKILPVDSRYLTINTFLNCTDGFNDIKTLPKIDYYCDILKNML